MAAFDQDGRNTGRNVSSAAQRHVPVMADRVVDLLAPAVEAARLQQRQPILVDATLGMGATELVFNDFRIMVIGIDRDTQALAGTAAPAAHSRRYAGISRYLLRCRRRWTLLMPKPSMAFY